MARCSSYTAGNCTAGACYAEGWIPEGLGNANQWLERAAAKGFATSDVPTVNAVAVFNDSVLYNYIFGHCAVVEAVASYDRFKVLEMNFTAFNAYDERWTGRTGLLGFILPPGTAAGTGMGGPTPVPSAAHELEAAWDGLAAFWNYVIDVQTVNLSNIANAIDLIN
jgi:surface antigen